MSTRQRTLIGGVSIVAVAYYAFWRNLQLQQDTKNQRDPGHPASIPTWQFRLAQAANPNSGINRPATISTAVLQGRDTAATSAASPGEESKVASAAGSLASKMMYPAEHQTPGGEGAISQKAPQRKHTAPGKEHQAYTKSPDYVDNYEK